jgi:hypothetical protein
MVLDELTRLPRASYDDQVDAYAQAMDRFTARQTQRAW